MTAVRSPRAIGSRRGGLDMDCQHGVYTAFGYRTVRTTNTEGWSYSEGSGDYHLEYDRGRLIDQSRDFYRNNAIYKGMIDRAVSYIVGAGFKLQIQGAKRTADQLEARWRQFQRRPEVRNLFSGADVADIICSELLLCGDATALKVKSAGEKRIQLVEAEQVADRNKAGTGISTTPEGRPKTFRICPWGRRGQVSVSAGQDWPAEKVLFVTSSRRSSQTRGEPALQAAFPMLHRINDACDSEAIAYQMISRFVLTVSRKDGEQKAYTESKVDPNSDGDTSGEMAARLTELGYAIIFQGEPGDEVKGIDRNIPSMNFGETIRMFLRLLGLPMGLPLELILLDWSKANYSQSRAVLEQAYQNFLKIQQKLIASFFDPLARWICPELDERDNLHHAWIAPTFPWIDQLKESQAQASKLDRCLTTHTAALKTQNLDRDEVIELRQREVAEAIAIAHEIKEKTGVDVPWQLFAGVETQKAEARPPDADSDDTDDKDTDDEDAADGKS